MIINHKIPYEEIGNQIQFLSLFFHHGEKKKNSTMKHSGSTPDFTLLKLT